MKICEEPRLPPFARAVIIRARVTSVTFAVLSLWVESAFAQQQPETKSDDLDVTMQIIVDPDAKLPDEVVRRIPLPSPKSAQPVKGVGAQPDAADAKNKGQERASEARELGQEMSELAKQKAQEAAEQREQARRSAAEDKRRDTPGRPADPPGRPPNPPGR